MGTLLLAWNPAKWEWKNLRDDIDSVNNGEEITGEASSVSQQAKVGDKVFTIRLGENPKGIFASGEIIDGPYENLHWNEEKAAQGETQNKYLIKYEKILDPDNDSILKLEDLQKKLPQRHNWTPQSSGIMVSPDIENELHILWLQTINDRKFTIQPEHLWEYPYSEKNQEEGLQILPYLVHLAKLGEPQPYSEVGKVVGIHHRAMAYPLGFIRDCICRANGLPLLTVMIVEKTTRLPAEGFLPEGRENLTDQEYQTAVEDYLNDVVLCDFWDKLISDLGLDPYVEKTSLEGLDKFGLRYSKALKNRSSSFGGGEGDRHLRLKNFIASHPEKLDLPLDSVPIIEHSFISGDEADVLFKLPDGTFHIVEIKKGPSEGELVKGIYQLVKYGALQYAEMNHKTRGHIPCSLVAYEIPYRVRKFAMLFMIQCYEITEAELQ